MCTDSKMITPERRTFISLNVINFIFYAGISCIMPFLSLHLRSIGLTLWHIIWVQVASGLICILIPLLVGTLAERRTSSPRKYLYKICFSVSLFIAIFGYTALLAVPKIQRIYRQPQIDFDCSSPMNAVVNLEKCANYETCGDVAESWSSDAQFRLSHCRFKYKGSEDMKMSPPDPSNPLQMCFRTTGNTTHHCLVYDPQVRENPTIEFSSDLTTWQFTEYRNVSAKEFSFSEVNSVSSPMSICNYVPATSGTVIKVNGRYHDAVTCQRSLNDRIEGIRCVLHLQTVDGKKSPCFDISGDLSTTFWACLGLRATADAFFICAFCLLEGVTLRTIQNGPYNRGAYGKSKFYPAIALGIFPPIAGVLVDKFSEVADTLDYSPAYFIFAAFELVACILIYALPLPVGGNTFRYDLSSDYCARSYGETPTRKFEISLESIVISVLAICLGTAWSVSQVFDPLQYQDHIHFSHITLGTFQSFVFGLSLPFLSVAKNLIQNIGEANLISTAFAFHSLHLAGLSFTEVWQFLYWSVPFETMKIFTIPILWIALVASVEHDSTKGKRIAMHYVLAMAHFGVGKILGCSVGGFLAEKYSFSLSYRVMALFCLVMSISYLCFHHCFMKPRHRKIVAARCALQRQSMNGSCLLLVETVPVNGRIAPSSQN
ncbi:uncharacterized protein LOC129970947 [Argiope bruennichi]|uniref:uncharacterized protein LOC129970947 n=1 Tax=Argiope bruennichi TaxID=94029 RepID=UPI0024953D9A|nr:uncharacterized protein LOC129970947 [Argiope bruennichi]